ncbi:MAG TPA: GatB/YqeY domain-containing protein [Candidatus Moranbacteria bacterium]|nr:GatB/YqeY domain-containing protein [Candidatus Moranbacteria bacterium]HRZ33416.1 GatB/YqeY domain-containing protein [Candidatus Moranbacteria bacterium]
MNLKEKITSDIKNAMLSGDTVRRDTLRFLDSAIKNFEIEKKKKDSGLSDEEILEVISRSVKQRKDSIQQYINGERPELAEKEKMELEILKTYMPEQISEDEIRKAVKEIISIMGAVGASEIGKVMGQAMAKLKGKADGNIVKRIVSEELQ